MAYGNTDGTEYPGRNLIWSEHNHKLEGRHFWLAEVRGLLLLSIEISAGRYCVSVKNATARCRSATRTRPILRRQSKPRCSTRLGCLM